MKNHLLTLVFVALLAVLVGAQGQDIYSSVAPNSNGSDTYVEIANPSGTWMHFYTDPTPSAARMRRADMQVDWPTTLFGPDPGQSLNRISANQSLRVYPKTLSAGTEILIEFSIGPGGQHYYIHVLVTAGARVDGMFNLDPTESTASTVRWRVQFDQPIRNVTAANFALVSGIPGISVTSATPDTPEPSANWTVTATTGSIAGTIALRWVGQRTETPPVPNSFIAPFTYNFSEQILYTQNLPTNTIAVLPNTTQTLAVIATRRSGYELFYRWYTIPPGSSTPVAIPGATSRNFTPPTTSSSYTPPAYASGTYQYFCSVFGSPGQEFTQNLFLYSNTATVSVLTLNAAAQAGFTNTTGTAPYSLATATGPSVAGGSFSGNGVSGDTFNPATAGIGVHTITYSVGGVQVNFTITVNEQPSLIVTTAADVVNNKDGLTSLREALTYAALLSGPRTVTFAAGVQGQTVTVSEGWNGASDDTALRLPDDVTIDGGTGVTIKLVAPTPRRIFLCGGVFALRNLTLSGGDIRGRQAGGALWSTGTGTLTNVRFTNNRADDGGAIYNLGTMTISGSSFDNNSTAANGYGGAIWSNSTLGVSGTLFYLNTAGQLGGAIISFNGLTVTDSTFSGNQSAFNGGALRLDGTAAISGSTFSNNTAVNGGGAFISHGQTTITNTTIAYNTALDGGGAQFFEGTASLRHVTLVNNAATRSGGGVAANFANVTMTNAIVAANSAPDQNNLWGAALNAASSNNLIDTPAARLYLGSIANNGGPTATFALLPGSPAINAGTAISGVTTDQRGFPRRSLASGGLLGRFYTLATAPTTALLSPLSNLEALAPSASVLSPRVDFGGGTETVAGDGTVLDRGGGTTPFAGVGVQLGAENVAALWTGFITVPETADYRFTTRSDDGSVLYIDGALVVNNNGFQPMTNVSGAVRLTAGRHALRLGYFQGSGGAGIQLSWEQLNGTAPFARQIVPPQVLSSGSAPDIGAFEDSEGNDDPDGDTLPNALELTLTTNPLARDTDGDGFNDATELLNGTDPKLATSFPGATHVERVLGIGAARGLDLTGNFRYAVNVGTTGAAGQIGDANFTADSVAGVTVTAPNENSNWTVREFGATTADNALETVFRSMRWGGRTDGVKVDAANLIPGRNYKLQLLFADTPGYDRAFDVRVNGATTASAFNISLAQGPNVSTSGAAAVVHEFTAPSSTMNVVLSGLNTAVGVDGNPVLNGFTLEEIPTAATAPLIAPVAGTYPGSVRVNISTTSAGATIRYTIDGSAPTETTGLVYAGSFDLSASGTVRAIAVGNGWLASPVSSANYTVLARPIAAADTIYRYPTQSTKIAVSALLGNDSSPEGRTPLSVTGVGSATSGQASVTLSGGYVFYLPANGYTGADTFTYTVADSAGVTATGTVTVSLAEDTNTARNLTAVALEAAPGGGMQGRIRFGGIPGRTYRIQSTDSLAPANWQTRATVAADAMGRLEFVDPPPLPPSRFYRSVTP